MLHVTITVLLSFNGHVLGKSSWWKKDAVPRENHMKTNKTLFFLAQKEFKEIYIFIKKNSKILRRGCGCYDTQHNGI
jgi:hypothetical protein